MKITKYLYCLLLLLATPDARSGDPVCWLTYGHSKFISSPGIEATYLFKPFLGLNMGVGFYIQDPDQVKVTSMIHESKVNFFSANIGLSGQFLNTDLHKAGLIAGIKLYYGPDYHELTYYEEGGYTIYFDGSSLQPEYGLDLGAFYSYKKISILTKYDFVRNRFRIGLGYRFN